MSSLKTTKIKTLKIYGWHVMCEGIEGHLSYYIYGYTKEESLAVLQEFVKTHFKEDYGRMSFEAYARKKFKDFRGWTDYETMTEQRRIASSGRHEKSFEECIKSRAGR